MPALRARETGLKDQIAALDAQAADRDAYLRLAEGLEGFLARLRQNAATATVEDRQRVGFPPERGGILLREEEISGGRDAQEVRSGFQGRRGADRPGDRQADRAGGP
jgi:hypothetical protein